jgi:hypothetical protein
MTPREELPELTEEEVARWSAPCKCGYGTVADCMANTCEEVRAAAIRKESKGEDQHE